MKYLITSNRINIILMGLLVLLGIGTFAYNQYLVNSILQQERSSIRLWAKALEYTGRPIDEEASQKLLTAISELKNNPTVSDRIINLIEEAEADRTTRNFVVEELITKEDRFRIPTIVTDEQGEIVMWNHLDAEDVNQKTIERFAGMHPPIEINFGYRDRSLTQYVYYGESPTVRLLRYFPYLQFSVLALLLGIAYVSYRTISKSEQSNLWVGMTKEAAHQLGTPLSSLYGWVELLREEADDSFSHKVADELEKDISRLREVAERFNKIGSKPELQTRPIRPVLSQVVDYMERRLPKLGKNVELRCNFNTTARARINPELFQWAVENLIKNAMDAVKANSKNAYVALNVHRIENDLIIDIEDSGVGIEKKYHSEVFKPGYSTKKRGWGLGLSLTKRIIEDYHKGKLFILRSEPGKGTTVRIVMSLEEEAEEQKDLPETDFSEPVLSRDQSSDL